MRKDVFLLPSSRRCAWNPGPVSTMPSDVTLQLCSVRTLPTVVAILALLPGLSMTVELRQCEVYREKGHAVGWQD